MGVKLALTMGDPAGIGPEIILKALADPDIRAQAEITLVGDPYVFQSTYLGLRELGLEAWDPDGIPVLESGQTGNFQLGHGDAVTGEASFLALQQGIQATLTGQFSGVVTAPIAKFAWAAAGRYFPGQTEVLTQMSEAHLGHKISSGMLFVARSPYTGWDLRVLLATTHIPLQSVPSILTPELVRSKLDLLLATLRPLVRDPCLAVAGLNPHSGEQGQLGREEVDWLHPLLVAYAQEHGIHLRGPVPPDTLWMDPARAWRDPGVQGLDGYLALYHDQGLIPVKMLAFDQAVNTTIGLPFVRTSPDHGTAFDIAGRGIARAESFKAAIRLAAEMATLRD